MIRVTHITRHPLKSHGREDMAQVALTSGEPIPYDRLWAVAHDASTADGSEWVCCVNFSRGSKAPALVAITAALDEATETLTLRHPLLPDLIFRPDHDAQALVDWVLPIVPQNRALPDRILRLEKRGFTDSDFPSVTLCNMSSHRAVEQKIGHPLSIHRWRGNFWFDGAAPWEEFDWIDREIRIGTAVVLVRERTERCFATTANPDNGLRDADTLGTLNSWGHQDFSVRAEVIQSGHVAIGDQIGLFS